MEIKLHYMCVCVVAYLPRGDMIVEAQRVCYEWRERGGLCVCVVCVWCVVWCAWW